MRSRSWTLVSTTLALAFNVFNAGAQTAPAFTALIEQSGTVVCSEFPSVSCELSAVAWVKNGRDSVLVFGNDKPPKSTKESSVFSMPYAGGAFQGKGAKDFYSFPPFPLANKFEAMSTSPDGNHVVAITAFDRYHENDYSLDKFNMLIAWPANDPGKARIVAASQRDGVESSRSLKGQLGQAIRKKFGGQATYFKVEGLALLPDNRVVFGIREIGQTYSAFEYRVVLIEGKYRIKNGDFQLDEKSGLEVIRDFSEIANLVGRKVGVSSIEYDAAKKQLYLLTSFEDSEEKYIGAYLWILPDENGSLGKSLSLVKTSDGSPFEFPHKAEGLAVLDGDRVFIIHDDDRNVTNVRIGGKNAGELRARKPNEAAFDIVQICSKLEPSPNCANPH